MSRKSTCDPATSMDVEETTKASTQEHGPNVWVQLQQGGLILLVTVAAVMLVVLIATTADNIKVEKHKPKPPYVEITHAHLLKLDYNNYNGHLNTKINLTVIARNDDPNSVFESIYFLLQSPLRVVADLKVHAPNNSLPHYYVLNSQNASVGDIGIDVMDDALKKGKVPFFMTVITNYKWSLGSRHFDFMHWDALSLDIALPFELQ